MEVPWFPGGLWVMDVPENPFGPFPAANQWPDEPEALVDWHVSADGSHAWYEKSTGASRLRFDAWVEGNSVFYRFRTRGVSGPYTRLDCICLKTISPLFSSQERMTQAAVVGGMPRMVSRMPVKGGGAPFAWHASELDADNACGLLRSFDGTAWVAFVGRPPNSVGGNGSIPCMHLYGRPKVDGEGGRIIFHVGPFDDLLPELKYSFDGA
jgi:hypothetical protein